MRKKVWVLAAVAVVAAITSVAVVQASGTTPARQAKLAPPVIHEPFAASPLPCPSNPSTTPELEGCLEKRLLASDKKIDSLDEAIFLELSKGPFFKLSKNQLLGRFLASHRTWLAYRRRDCPELWATFEEGTIFPTVVGECELVRNEQRIEGLRAFQRFPEG